MIGFKEQFLKSVLPALQKELGLRNKLAAPRLVKIVVSTGTGRKDSKEAEGIQKNLETITGQRCVGRQAKKSIATFKTRKGMTVGFVSTLRGRRMYDFLEKLVNVALARLRDFRGLDPKSMDSGGNLTIGFKEHIVFPEIAGEEVKTPFGLEITLVVKAGSKEQALALYKALGLRFKK